MEELVNYRVNGTRIARRLGENKKGTVRGSLVRYLASVRISDERRMQA